MAERTLEHDLISQHSILGLIIYIELNHNKSEAFQAFCANAITCAAWVHGLENC